MTGDAAEINELASAVMAGDRSALARAITVVESGQEQQRARARLLLQRTKAPDLSSCRVAISGSPGAGKSSLLDRLGCEMIDRGHRVAVLAVDPSSAISGGSILGDKTRMVGLMRRPEAFIRPSPTRGTLGGVASRTREAMLLCEAAGFDVVFIETVGVGQSEINVRHLADLLISVFIAGAGDQLQGIKRGLLEVVDIAVINKADGANVDAAKRDAGQLRSALALLRGSQAPEVLLCSALEGTGVTELCDQLMQRWEGARRSGELIARRREQELGWMHLLIDEMLRARFARNAAVKEALPELEEAVRNGHMDSAEAARNALAVFLAQERN